MTHYKRERIKTHCIFILFMLLLVMTAVNWIYDRPDITTRLWHQMQGLTTSAPPVNLLSQIPESAQPSAIAIRIDGQTLGAQYSVHVAQTYDTLKSLIGEALASASKGVVLDTDQWVRALDKDCVFITFPMMTPAWIYAEGLTSTLSDDLRAHSFNRLLLVPSDNETLLLLLSTGEGYYQYETPLRYDIPLLDMSQLSPLQWSGALSPAVGVARDTLVSEQFSTMPLVMMQATPMSVNALAPLLISFGFNPNTESRYTEQNGDLVFVDDERTLHVSPTGAVRYHDSSQSTAPTITITEAVRLALQHIPQGHVFWGDGGLALSSTSTIQDSVQVSFHYVRQGAVFLDTDAVLTLRAGRLVEAQLQLFPATAMDMTQELLPQKQAALILPVGKRLALQYARGDDGVWYPQWYAIHE